MMATTACRRCGGDFIAAGGSTLCDQCVGDGLRDGSIRRTCSRCAIYGTCKCDICGMPSLHVGEIPQPTFRCSGCAEKEQRAWRARVASAREELQATRKGTILLRPRRASE
jgi:hypothetical protein